MAQQKSKRRRKHRGTQAGTIDRSGRTGNPRTRQDAKSIARERRQHRLDSPPTWRGAVNRAAIAAVILLVLLITPLFDQPVATSVMMAVLAFAIYIPLGYLTDRAVYRFRQRKKQQPQR